MDASKSNKDAKKEHQEDEGPRSPQQCSTSNSDNMSSLTNSSSIAPSTNHDDMSINDVHNVNFDSLENSLALDEDFWSEVLSSDNSGETSGVVPATTGVDYQFQFPFSSLGNEEGDITSASSLSLCDGMEFWYDVYARAEEITELLEL